MENELITYSRGFLEEAETAIPSIRVDSPESERRAADLFAKCELVMRDIEAKRLSVSKPMSDAVKSWNGKAKEAAEPWQRLSDALSESLSAWRESDGFQKLMLERRKAETELSVAERAEDVEAMSKANETLIARLALAPKSIRTSTEAVIQFRSDIVIDGIDESALDDRYFTRSVNEKLIKDDLKAGMNVNGVRFRQTHKPLAVVR